MRRVRTGGLIALALVLGCTSPGASEGVASEGVAAEVDTPVPGGPVRTDPWKPASAAAVEDARAKLERVVRAEALASADETWMLAHAVEAFGTGVETHAGENAVDAMLARASTDGGGPHFAGASESGTLRDPHPNHTLATLLAADPPRMQPMLRTAVASFERPASWGEHAWTLRALAIGAATGLADESFTNAEGETFSGLVLARAAARSIEADMQFLADARRDGTAVRKRGQGVWAQPCGGLHLIEAVAVWLFVREDAELRASLEHIRDVLAYRVGVEADLYAWMRGQAPPEIRVKLDAQELKFFGHVLDVAGDLERAQVPLPDAVLDEARARLVAAVQRLADARAFDRLAELRRDDPQLYRDLVGDAAHAVAGLALHRARDEHTVTP